MPQVPNALGLSENRLNPYTQWFCWSLSLLNGYFIGGILHFQTYPFRFTWLTVQVVFLELHPQICTFSSPHSRKTAHALADQKVYFDSSAWLVDCIRLLCFSQRQSADSDAGKISTGQLMWHNGEVRKLAHEAQPQIVNCGNATSALTFDLDRLGTIACGVRSRNVRYCMHWGTCGMSSTTIEKSLDDTVKNNVKNWSVYITLRLIGRKSPMTSVEFLPCVLLTLLNLPTPASSKGERVRGKLPKGTVRPGCNSSSSTFIKQGRCNKRYAKSNVRHSWPLATGFIRPSEAFYFGVAKAALLWSGSCLRWHSDHSVWELHFLIVRLFFTDAPFRCSEGVSCTLELSLWCILGRNAVDSAPNYSREQMLHAPSFAVGPVTPVSNQTNDLFTWCFPGNTCMKQCLHDSGTTLLCNVLFPFLSSLSSNTSSSKLGWRWQLHICLALACFSYCFGPVSCQKRTYTTLLPKIRPYAVTHQKT